MNAEIRAIAATAGATALVDAAEVLTRSFDRGRPAEPHRGCLDFGRCDAWPPHVTAHRRTRRILLLPGSGDTVSTMVRRLVASTMRAGWLSHLNPAQRNVMFRGLGYNLAQMTG